MIDRDLFAVKPGEMLRSKIVGTIVDGSVVFEAEARFGVVLRRQDGAAVPTRVVAEQHVRAVMGRVLPAHTLLRHIRGQRWMTAARRPKRISLEVG